MYSEVGRDGGEVKLRNAIVNSSLKSIKMYLMVQTYTTNY